MYFTSKICEILNRIYFEEHLLTTLLDKTFLGESMHNL